MQPIRLIAITLATILGLCPAASAQIPKPADAPKPLSPEESGKGFKVPRGFRVELVASEPLILEPSGVCWDERGRLFVCELHGYNLEGQYDIEELNRTGKLDRVVRRIQANPEAKKAAEAHTYGTIKLLHDADGDGRMDRAEVWADRLPPCHGICPARGGVIAACETQVLFLADRDGDGKAEVRDVLFEGFAKGPLERSINCPQWGPDNWIYIGRGAGGGTIRGKYLKKPVQLPSTDFRIKPDGSAIEPVVGATHTMGFAFTESGDRFVVSTRTPGIFVAPLPWKYLARNPDVAFGSLEQSATGDQRVYPTSKPHPWRTRRAEDPGFSKYYTDRYGIQESAPNGYFTSACSPLVYRDVTLPGLRGQLLACEPAQNLIHRGLIERDGTRLTLRRAPGEEKAEFLTSSDSWFHAIALSHAPDGSIFITDFYREIIEDYSAIPRYLQQQYGLSGGKDHGRLWRLTHESAKPAPPSDMSRLKADDLAREVGSPHHWRRQTSRRLLVEQQRKDVVPVLARLCRAAEPATVFNALHTLDGLDALKSADIESALTHADASVRREALRFAEGRLDEGGMLDRVLAMATDGEPMVRLQLALSLGESRDSRALTTLVRLAVEYGDEPWMVPAILSSLRSRGGLVLGTLLRSADKLGKAERLLEPLCAAIGARRQAEEMSQALPHIAGLSSPRLQTLCLRGLCSSIKGPVRVSLNDEARQALKQWKSSDAEVRKHVQALITTLRIETIAERRARLDGALKDLGNIHLPAEARLDAAAQLAAEDDVALTRPMLEALGTGTPRVREAILNGVLSRRDRFPAVLDAIEQKVISPSDLSALQRSAFIEDREPAVRRRAETLFARVGKVDEKVFERFVKALREKRDTARGQQVFRDKCATCHQAHGIGVSVGPDLNAEFQRAEETIIKDILAPGDTISPGYRSFSVSTRDGRVLVGLLASESPTSVTLRQPEGKELVILRKDIDEFHSASVSLMPENLFEMLTPRDAADVIAWLRRPPTHLVLLDENRNLADALNEGKGTAQFITTDRHSGQISLRVTPPQRYSPGIEGWSFPVRENPGPGEYRFVRFAWKSDQAAGVMLEFAAAGQWPPAEKALRRYHAGTNTTGWQSVEVSPNPPRDWTVVTRDLWKDFGDFTLTGIAPTAMGGPALFDRIELLQTLEER